MKDVNFPLKSNVSRTDHIFSRNIVILLPLISSLGFFSMNLIKFWYQVKQQETCVHTLLIIVSIVQFFSSIGMVVVHPNMCKTSLVCPQLTHVPVITHSFLKYEEFQNESKVTTFTLYGNLSS